MKESPDLTGGTLDTGGLILISLALLFLTGGLSFMRLNGPTDLLVLGARRLGILLFIPFARYELAHDDPLIDVRMFRSPSLWPVFLTAGLFGVQRARRAGAAVDLRPHGCRGGRLRPRRHDVQTSLLVGAYVLSLVVGAMLFPLRTRWLHRASPSSVRARSSRSAICCSSPSTTDTAQVLANMIIAGIGSGALVAALPAAAAAAAPAHQTGVATGLTNSMKTLGGAIASCVFGIALLGATSPASRPSPAGSRRKRHSPFRLLRSRVGPSWGRSMGRSRSHGRGRRQSVAIVCHTAVVDDTGRPAGRHDLRRRAGGGRGAVDGLPRVLPPGPGQRRDGRAHPAGRRRARLPRQSAGPGPLDGTQPHDRAGRLRRRQPVLLRDHPRARRPRRPQAGCTILLADAQESDRLERASLERVLPVVDGVVLGGSRMSDSAIRMIAKQKPVVVLNRAVVDVPSVVPDNAGGIRLAVEHLSRLGHDAVTYVAGPEASWADGMRWRSLQDAAADLHLRVRRIGPFTPDVPGGMRAAEEVASSARDRRRRLQRPDGDRSHPRARLPRGGRARGRQRRRLRQHRRRGADHAGADDGRLAAAHRGRHRRRSTCWRWSRARSRRTGSPMVLPVRLVERGSTAQRRRKRTSPASGTTSVSPSAR